MLRFAMSPTKDMNIDDLRIALFNFIVSKQKDEDLLVRIEDMDKSKNIEGKDQEILDLLALFSIEYSQIIYQSESVRFHSAMALQLMHEKKAFSCFCSPEWLEKKHQEAKEKNIEYKYDDACRNLPAELVIDNTSPFTIRAVKPDEAKSTADSMDSFVILHQDKTPTQNFSTAVDDMLNDISTVVCSQRDEIETPRQEHIRDSLKYDKKIEYIYLPIIENEEDVNVKNLLKEGFLPEAILNYLISTIIQTPKGFFTLKEAMVWFDISKILNSPTSFDMGKLKQVNREYLKSLDAKELSRYVGFADTEIGELARIYLNEVSTTKELKAKITPIFAPRDIAQKFADQTATMATVIKSAPYFDEYEDFKNFVMPKSGFTEDEFVQTLRLLLTNAENGPNVADIYKYLKNYLGEIIK